MPKRGEGSFTERRVHSYNQLYAEIRTVWYQSKAQPFSPETNLFSGGAIKEISMLTRDEGQSQSWETQLIKFSWANTLFQPTRVARNTANYYEAKNRNSAFITSLVIDKLERIYESYLTHIEKGSLFVSQAQEKWGISSPLLFSRTPGFNKKSICYFPLAGRDTDEISFGNHMLRATGSLSNTVTSLP